MRRPAASRMLRKHFVLAYVIAIAALQFAENDSRKDGQRAQNEERLMNSVDHLRRIRMEPVGMKKAVASDAVATPKLIDICCIVLAMVLAPLT